MAVTVDYWQVLDLAPGADGALLKQAFREQARRWHPDLNGNDPVAEERFKLVNEAYAVLSDPLRRRAWETGAGTNTGTTDQDAPYATGFPEFQDYLDTLFGSRPAATDREDLAPAPEAPPDDDDDEEVDLPRSWVPRWGPFGAAPVTPSPAPPPPVRASVDQESIVALSPEQALSGERVELDLPDGTVVEVWTPPRAGDGWRLRLEGVAPGGRDHFLQLRVRTPEGLRVEGLRLHYTLELSAPEAALGCHAIVPTLGGPVRLRVPAGSSSGRLLRLRSRGLSQGNEIGDQIVELRIVVPPSLGEAEQALYRRLLELQKEAEATDP
ncbi:MAG: DnaJ domain-containing protein [Cyanobacteria bacterium]|nr:DnaJ domain-containing protein [Cyanobacteriota bacterium]